MNFARFLKHLFYRTPVNDFIKTEDYIKLYIKHKTIDLFKLAYTIYSKNEAFRE